MSTRHYRYYNSAFGVGVTLLTRMEGGAAYIAGRDKKVGKWSKDEAERKAYKPFVRPDQLYLTAQEAFDKPYAVFAATPAELPKVMPDFQAMDRDELGAWYIQNVGYDLGSDDLDMSLQAFRDTCTEHYVRLYPEHLGIQNNR